MQRGGSAGESLSSGRTAVSRTPSGKRRRRICRRSFSAPVRLWHKLPRCVNTRRRAADMELSSLFLAGKRERPDLLLLDGISRRVPAVLSRGVQSHAAAREKILPARRRLRLFLADQRQAARVPASDGAFDALLSDCGWTKYSRRRSFCSRRRKKPSARPCASGSRPCSTGSFAGRHSAHRRPVRAQIFRLCRDECQHAPGAPAHSCAAGDPEVCDADRYLLFSRCRHCPTSWTCSAASQKRTRICCV